ncbi:ABC transporter ATP-binding protein [Rickettsiella grylli]|uniref:ABC transporter ATP-binding protein n=1 Tax=Rickettsiella grylli TaxID=59196 RepID=UPI0000DAE645|nr:ABC transporter ATP-binding protein [Rickettsiella grylli]OJA00119.1 sugar ABC transporter ATP-binding protein [Rickettsiella grylli]
MALIELNSLYVDFPIYHHNARSIRKSFLRFTGGGIIHKEKETSRIVIVKALDNISFTLNHGDRLGLIGHNGAGKSTLLRVLAKIYEPSQGSITIEGRVSPLLNVMLGVNPESTGYENILMRGVLLGLSQKEIQEKVQEIADFTELGDYLSVPIRTYSTGMQLRLAFAVATCIKPEILLMDEMIEAGDANFKKKAEARLTGFIEQTSILVLASHSNETIRRLCNKVALLEKGKLKYFGPLEEGFVVYEKLNSD